MNAIASPTIRLRALVAADVVPSWGAAVRAMSRAAVDAPTVTTTHPVTGLPARDYALDADAARRVAAVIGSDALDVVDTALGTGAPQAEVDALRSRVASIESELAALRRSVERRRNASGSTWLRPCDIARRLGTTEQRVGRAITALGLRDDATHASPYTTDGRHSGASVIAYRYSPAAVRRIGAHVREATKDTA